MTPQLGRTTELVNTHFAPVAALIVYYEAQNVLEPLQSVTEKDENKLEQVILSLLTGCRYLAEVNTKLRPERKLAQVKRIDCFADQSTLSRSLDDLSQMNLVQLEACVRQISRRCSRTASPGSPLTSRWPASITRCGFTAVSVSTIGCSTTSAGRRRRARAGCRAAAGTRATAPWSHRRCKKD